MIGRRAFVSLVGGAAAAWPLAARAQQAAPTRRIGMLMNVAADTPQGKAFVSAFMQALQKFGWSDGRNVRIDIRWGENDAELDRKYAAELVALAPDVIVAGGTVGVAALENVTRTLPIVFVQVSDPVGAGIVGNLNKPGGNVSGFMMFEYSFSGKWLELLNQISPGVMRVAVLRDSGNPAGIAQFGAIRAMAASLGIDVSPIDVRRARSNASEIERAVADFAHSPSGGLIATPSTSESIQRDLIVPLAARYRLPAVYSNRSIVTAGGLVSYGPDLIDQYRQAADYINRILNGERPGDLPVQAPTKYELVVNLKTAKALGVVIPPSLLATADEVVE